jgi:hypothetical protein
LPLLQFFEERELSTHRGVLECLIEPDAKIFEVERLREVVRGATSNGGHGTVDLGARGHHDHGGGRVELERSVHDFEAVAIG